jgi:hypothetical protein
MWSFCDVSATSQVFSAGNLYGVPLTTMCESYSGSSEVSDAASFTALLQEVMKQRTTCFEMPFAEGELQVWDDENMGLSKAAQKCCKDHSPRRRSWYFSGICADPWTSRNASLTDIAKLPIADSLRLFTDILSDFIGVQSPNHYDTANAEFWCKNCPNDYRKNCPFDPALNSTSGDVCKCPGGELSNGAFWAIAPENQITGRYILCSDQAKVYRAWIEALYPREFHPEWDTKHYQAAEDRFYNTCFARKGSLGFILTVGPVLSVFAALFTLFSLLKYCATTGLPGMAFNFVLLAISMTLISFWPLSFTGAAELIARYSFCWGLQDTPVVNKGDDTTAGAPVLFTGAPCYDINSKGEREYNPFIEQLGTFSAGYVSGGVLMIMSMLMMLSIVSKNADVVLESKLARPDPMPDSDPRADQL